MKRIFLFATLLFSTISALRAQEVVYDANAEVRRVGSFSAIEVSGTISVYLTQSTEAGLAISAGEERYNSKIKTEVKNGVLKISVDAGVWNGFSWSNRKLKAYVSVIDLTRLEVSGASYVTIAGNLKSNSLKLDVSGASEIKGALAVKNFNIDISGASVVRLTGDVEKANVDASGAARVHGFDLRVDNGKLEASGASHIALTVIKELSANASGGSTIQYDGNPVTKTINSSAGASIKKRS